MDMTCKKCVASKQRESHEQATSQDCWFTALSGFSCLCWFHWRTVLAPPGLCSAFESVHAGVAPRKLVDFFKRGLRENAFQDDQNIHCPWKEQEGLIHLHSFHCPPSHSLWLILMPWNISVLVWKGSTVVAFTPGQSSSPKVRLSIKAKDEALEVQ